MRTLQRKHNNLLKIIENSTIKVVCPQCLKGFPRSDKLYDHFRRTNDDVHRGLALRQRDYKTFLESYQRALRSSIPAAKLPVGWNIFSVEFVAEHYGENEDRDSPLMNSETCSIPQDQANNEAFGDQPVELHSKSDAAITQPWALLSPDLSNQTDSPLDIDSFLEYSAPTYVDQCPLGQIPETRRDNSTTENPIHGTEFGIVDWNTMSSRAAGE